MSSAPAPPPSEAMLPRLPKNTVPPLYFSDCFLLGFVLFLLFFILESFIVDAAWVALQGCCSLALGKARPRVMLLLLLPKGFSFFAKTAESVLVVG